MSSLQKQTITFVGFISYTLIFTESWILIDLKHKFRNHNLYFEPSDISFDYFSDIQINRIAGENHLRFIKENELIIDITRDKFEYKRLKSHWNTWKTIKKAKRRKHELLYDFLKRCEGLIKQALIDCESHKEG